MSKPDVLEIDDALIPAPPTLRRRVAIPSEDQFIDKQTGEIVTGSFDLDSKSNANLISYNPKEFPNVPRLRRGFFDCTGELEKRDRPDDDHTSAAANMLYRVGS